LFHASLLVTGFISLSLDMFTPLLTGRQPLDLGSIPIQPDITIISYYPLKPTLHIRSYSDIVGEDDCFGGIIQVLMDSTLLTRQILSSFKKIKITIC
jgi:hypothetical protein